MNLGIKKILTSILKDPSKLVTIADAWLIARKPTPEQKELAEARWNICVQCDQFREERDITGDPHCNDCGCPLKKKIFTAKYNECPLEKWKDVDDLLHAGTLKNNQTLL
jgi:uncharacterized paraquat-inducible protein A